MLPYFFAKTGSSLSKNAYFVAKIFGNNIFKIITVLRFLAESQVVDKNLVDCHLVDF
jgi:hypothetical protein